MGIRSARPRLEALEGRLALSGLTLVSVSTADSKSVTVDYRVEGDPVQAGMWSLIYHANGARIAIGLPNISAALQARLDGVLSEKAWQQARSLADSWSPRSQDAAN